MNKKKIYCAILALTGLAYGCSLDNFVNCDEGAMMCEGNDVMQCINSGYVRVKTCDVACENAACILCDKSINPTKCEADSYYECTSDRTWKLVKSCTCQDETSCKADDATTCENGNQCASPNLIQSDQDTVDVVLDKNGKAENLSLTVTYLVSGVPDSGHTLHVSTNNSNCIAINTSEVTTGSNAVIGYHATSSTSCDAELIIKDADGQAKLLTVQVKVWDYNLDNNSNHFHDLYESSAPNFGKTCRVDTDCDSAEGAGDGFCDSFSGFTCTKRCTSNDQCIQNVDGFNFVCRQDGRCASDAFMIEWSDQTNIAVMPIDIDAEYDIDWGDGTTEHHAKGETNTANTTKHEFKTAGKHVIRITGNYHFSVDKVSEEAKLSTENITYKFHAQNHLTAVRAFGPVGLQAGAFQDCHSLTALSAVDIPDSTQLNDLNNLFHGAFNKQNCEYNYALLPYWDLSHVQNTSKMFYCEPSSKSNFNADISRWNMSNVTNMSYMFKGATHFNQDIGKWNVASVNDMSYMFNRASAFNQDLDEWKTGNVTNMSYMFANCDAFNGKISRWNVSNVTNMDSMFYYASAFNQDIGAWDVSKVTDMSHMFSGASAFNQDIGKWNVASVNEMSYMFDSAVAFSQDIGNWPISKDVYANGMFTNTNQAMQEIVDSWKTRACNEDALTLSCLFQTSDAN